VTYATSSATRRRIELSVRCVPGVNILHGRVDGFAAAELLLQEPFQLQELGVDEHIFEVR